ncbi:MAG: hypothetical protein ACYC53_00945 [Bacillota bacterium]
MGSGRLALLAGLVAAGLSALVAAGAGVTETEMFTRSTLAFIVFALLTKGVATIVTSLVPELAGGTVRPAEGRSADGQGADTKGPSTKRPAAGGPATNDPAAPEDRGGRLNVVLPGTSAEEMLNVGTGKEVAG